MSPRDPYRYFRIEGQELTEALARGLLALEGERARAELLRDLLRHAHTLKGAARVVGATAVAELAHDLEDVVAAIPEGAEVPSGTVTEAVGLVDGIRAQLARLGQPETPAPPPAAPTLRLERAELDELLAATVEARSISGRMRRELGALEALRATAAALGPEAGELVAGLAALERRFGDASEELGRELDDLRELATELRLVPADGLAHDLERAVRDAAASLGKEVAFRCSGGEVRLEADVLARLRGPLLHVVRNAVDHGIEDADARRAAGKPARGSVEIQIERQGARATLRCRDDGRGVDFDRVRAAVRARDGVDPAQASELDTATLERVLWRGGISTSEEITHLSGRGVGLDAVRSAVEQLGGTVGLRSELGGGTEVEISVPVSLSALPVLRLEHGDATALVPLDASERALAIEPGALRWEDRPPTLALDGVRVPFLLLGAALKRPTGEAPPAQALVVVAGRRRAAIGIDAVRGLEQAVVRPLPAAAAADPVVVGAAFDDAGTPELVVSPPALIELAERGARPAPRPRTAAARPPILVVDDSLTTRMLEQSILESAGYAVELAESAEEALALARARRFVLFLVDVEMPGMDGFEFITRIRADPELRDIPAVLVTSRSDPADKRRGSEVGARAYVVKSEFDQGILLATIRRLIDA